MNLFCIICAHPYPVAADSLLPEYKDTCPKCRKILTEEAPEVSLYDNRVYDPVVDAIEELESRIPALFSGPCCPLEFLHSTGCSCTYKIGCIALQESKDKRIDRKIKRVTKNDKKLYNNS